MRKALLVGISGKLGSALLDALLNDIRYKGITVLTRYEGKRLRNIHVKKVKVDFSNVAEHLSSFEGIDCVFCLLGSDFINTTQVTDTDLFDYEYPLSVAKVAKQAGVKSFVLLNNSKSSLALHHPKFAKRAALELEIQRLQFENLYIFRVNKIAKSIDSKNNYFSFSKIIWNFMQVTSFGKLNKYLPTPANVLAQKMVNAVSVDTLDNREFSPSDY
jgi:hypothetical protein